MAISGISGSGSTGGSGSDAVTSAFGLGKDQFFKLFLSQLANQDPTSPIDDKAMLGELAQFTMIDTLQQVEKALGGVQLAQSSAMIGRTITGSDVKGAPVSGTVDRLVQSNGELYLMVGDQAIKPDAVVDVTSA